MGWGEAHRTGAGTTGQIEDAHKALDCVSIAPGPLAVRVLEAVGRIAARTEIDHWNYRVLTRSTPIADTGDHDESFEIIEVYYDADDNVLAWAAATPGGESPNELQTDLLKMAEIAGLATLKGSRFRPLTLDDFPGDLGRPSDDAEVDLSSAFTDEMGKTL